MLELSARLSPKERRVLAFVGAGLPNKQIAREIGVEESTVRSHVKHLLAKTGMTNRVQLAVLSHGVNPDVVLKEARAICGETP